MPENNDGNVDLPVETETEENDMTLPDGSDRFHAMAEQNMAQLGQTGVIAQNNMVFVTKAQDLDYLVNNKMVSLPQALGAREVGSTHNPGGPRPRETAGS